MADKVKIIRSKRRVVSDKTVYELAKERIHTTFDLFDSVSVSFSGGKDSTAVLQMVLEVAQERDELPLHVFFFDEEAIPYQTEEYVRRIAQRPDIDLDWYCLPVQHRNACSRKDIYWYPYAPEVEDKWVRPLPPEAITELDGFPIFPPEARLTMPQTDALLFDPQRDGNVAMFMGIRAQESMTRQRAVTQKTKENFIVKYNETTSKGNLWRVYPIYDWRTEDVWTAPAQFGWDYNCNPGDAPIWMSDYTFKRLDEVQVGDEVIGWERPDQTRKGGSYTKDRLCKSTVLRSAGQKKSVVKITLSSGRVIRCTPDHKWLIAAGQESGSFYYGIPESGSDMSFVTDTDFDVNDQRLAAWLAGVYDGEGCGDRIYQSPTHNPDVYEQIQVALERLDIPYVKLNGRSKAQHGFRIAGGSKGLTKFLNICRPVRRGRWVDEIELKAKFRTRDTVIAIEPDGEEYVYALETTTGNYVCWGYASKNSAYDVMEMAGLSHPQQRCSPAFGEEPLQKLWTYHHCFPEIWDKMTDRVPGAAAAARYATTELYGFGKRPEKPFSMSWEDWVSHLIEQWPEPAQRDYVADRIGREMNKHFKKTSDPLAVKASHPLSGMCWDFITSIAMRGDFKTRRSPMARINPSDMESHWEKYHNEIQEMLEQGQL